jgi:hypothetical protein
LKNLFRGTKKPGTGVGAKLICAFLLNIGGVWCPVFVHIDEPCQYAQKRVLIFVHIYKKIEKNKKNFKKLLKFDFDSSIILYVS